MSIGNSRNLINAVNERARTQQRPNNSYANGGQGRALDVTARTHRNIALSHQDPNAIDGHLDAYVAGIKSAAGNSDQGKAFAGEAISSAQEAKELAKVGLGKAGAAMNWLTGLEQKLSEPFSSIKFPAMPAARVFDLAIGFPHGHTHPPTFGTPLPSIGPVIPLPWGFSGAENTTINGRKAARCGDMGIGVWCGGYFPIYEILLGSSSVWIEGSRAARMGVDLTLHCIFSELPSPKDIPEVGIPLGLMVTASENVIIGGFPLPSLVNLLMEGAFSLLGKGLGKAVRAAKKAARKATDEAAKEVAEAAEKAANKAARNGIRKAIGDRLRSLKCMLTGHPVDIASGRVFTTHMDFQIPGRIPIEFNRIYDTSAVDYEGPLGHGWMHPYDMHIWVDDAQEMVILRNEEAVMAGFNIISIGEKEFNPLEKSWLERLDDNIYIVRDQDGVRYKFAPIPSHGSAPDGKSEATALRLIEIEDRNGNRIDLSYEDGRLSYLKDGAGTTLNFSYIRLESGTDRLIEVNRVLDEKSNCTARLVNFTYDAEGRLINATDRGFVPWRYAYDDHLLIRETNRNGLSFHFAYRGKGKDARCVHTWGDGGIYERWLDYDVEGKRTIVENSLGAKTTCYFNEFDLPVKIVDALGGEKKYRYSSKGELLSEMDEIGRTTKYKYNALADCISITHPDGSTRRFGYTGDSLQQWLIDECGAEFHREYDQHGNIIATIDALGNRSQYIYNQYGDLEKTIDSLGGETKFKWNEHGQIIEFITPLGAVTRYGYEERGNLAFISDPLGHMTKYTYDALDRLIQMERPDGTKQRFEYDPEGNLTNFVDANGAETRCRYIDYNELGESIDALGYRRRFIYNTEGNLVEVHNERGEAYRLTYDALDKVIREVGFDGLTWKYDYDAAGQLIARTDPASRTTRFVHDLCGIVIEKTWPDGSAIKFSYDCVGRLLEADAPGSKVEYKYDALGRIVWESQNREVIKHEYDALGRRIKRCSPSGQTVEFTYNSDSHLSSLHTPHGLIEFDYDKAGQLVRQRMPGELEESFYYDHCGHLIEQSVYKQNHLLFIRGYKYDAEGNLIVRSDSKRGTSIFTYDPVERLREATQPERTIEQFIYDSTGNLLRRKGREFRYDLPNRLTQADDAKLIYDEVGNVVEKRRAGSVIHYKYDADNRLISINSKEGGRVEFVYDALGRRIAKSTEDGKTGFIWDGGVLLAEQQGNRLNEYVFKIGCYEPLCRYDESSIELYHNDHLGTPQELTNDKGQVVWAVSYDVYGQIRKSHFIAVENPVRFQGQYEDKETGLYYNFYRYYDPESGIYISQDPIGLMGELNQYVYTHNPINRIDPLGLKSWTSCRRDYWRALGNVELNNPSGLFSARNIQRMLSGRAPRMRVEVKVKKTGQIVQRDVSLELHHNRLPQRLGTDKAHETWNLVRATPWGHDAMDPFRHTGYKVLKIITGTNKW